MATPLTVALYNEQIVQELINRLAKAETEIVALHSLLAHHYENEHPQQLTPFINFRDTQVLNGNAYTTMLQAIINQFNNQFSQVTMP